MTQPLNLTDEQQRALAEWAYCALTSMISGEKGNERQLALQAHARNLLLVRTLVPSDFVHNQPINFQGKVYQLPQWLIDAGKP